MAETSVGLEMATTTAADSAHRNPVGIAVGNGGETSWGGMNTRDAECVANPDADDVIGQRLAIAATATASSIATGRFREHRSSHAEFARRIRYTGMELFPEDTYVHFLLSQTWLGLLALFSFVAFLITLIFAFGYFLAGCGFSCGMKHNFFNAWNLSVQTFLTIGYGSLAPQNDLANVLVFFQGFSQLLLASVFAGVPYLKFTRNKAQVAFSRYAAVGMTLGRPSISFRLCKLRAYERLYNVVLHAYMIQIEDGMIRMFPLALNKQDVLIFSANYNAVHFLDGDPNDSTAPADEQRPHEESPLMALWRRVLKGQEHPSKCEIQIHLSMTAWDPVNLAQVHASHFYSWVDLHFECQFGDMIFGMSEGQPFLRVRRLDTLVRQDRARVRPDPTLARIGIRLSRRALAKQEKQTSMSKATTEVIASVSSRRRKHRVRKRASIIVREQNRKVEGLSTIFMRHRQTDESCGHRALFECRKMCWPQHSILWCCRPCCASRQGNAVVFRPAMKVLDRHIPIADRNGYDDCCRGSTWSWYLWRWRRRYFLAVIFMCYLALIAVMAVFVYANNHIQGTNLVQDVDPDTGVVLDNVTDPANFGRSFFFAHQTISSIGYGVLSPRSDATHNMVTFFGFFGFIGLSMLSGLIWSKFLSTKPLVTPSAVAVVTRFRGKRALMFRVAGLWRDYPVVTGRVTAMIYFLHNPRDGSRTVMSQKLKFVRPFNPLLALPATFIHLMDEDGAPMQGVTAAEMARKNYATDPLWISVVFEGLDTCLGTTVAVEFRFESKSILFGQRFQDLIEVDRRANLIRVDMSKFHLTEPDGVGDEEEPAGGKREEQVVL